MSFKEINELRKGGKLEEALQMVNRDLESDPDNIWIKRAASWVYYAYIKNNAKLEYYETFLLYLGKLRDLDLPEDDNMVFDKVAWQIGSMVYSIQKEEFQDSKKCDDIFVILKSYYFTAPSEGYSFLLKAFIKISELWHGYLDSVDWWNLENLRKEDFLNEEYKGRKTPSLAERAYMAYAKKLLEGEPVDHFGNNREIDKERISAFMPKLDHLIDEHPDFLYPSFYKAKLLLLMGDEEDVLSAFIPFARQKKNDFWVWEQMADIFHDDDELRMACYCKALTLKTQEDFLVKLRQTFSAFLVQKELYEEAKTEIDIVMDTRQKNQWGVPRQIAAWKDENWYKSAEAKLNNNNFYMKHKAKAEELLYRDIPEEVIVVEFVNKDKKMISFVKDKKKHGFFKYAGYLHKPQIGDIIKVRFDGEGQDGFYKILFAGQANKDSSSEAIKDFEGVLNIRPNNNFGFIDDNFVESKFIEDNSLADGQFIRGKAILSFNRKKESWGWKVLTISNMD